jgi:hypothetical protein
MQLPLPTPAHADRGAAPLRAGQVLSLSAEAAAARAALGAAQLNDRMAQHTASCKICSTALQSMRARATLARRAAAVLVAAAVGVLAGVVVPGLLAATGDAAPAAAAAARLAGAAATLLAASATLAASIARKLEAKIAEFVYVEFSHATNE